jgi:multiple sugar transport system substrate-binding protein
MDIKRVMLIIIAVIAIILVGVFYFSKPRTPPPQLTILGEDSSNLRAMASIAPDFKRLTGVDVRFVPQTFEQLERTSDTSLSHGANTYDLILNYNFSLAPYVRNDWIVPLDKLPPDALDNSAASLDTDLFPNAWREIGYYRIGDGPMTHEAAVAYPFAANTMFLCYNRKMFDSPASRAKYFEQYKEELIPPRDWDHFRRVAAFFTSAADKTYGVALQGGSGGWLYYEWVNFAFSFGGGVMQKTRGWEGDQHTPLLLTDPKTVAATDYYLSLKPYSAGDYFATGANEQRELMRGGQVAMAIMWSDYAYGLLYDKASGHENDFGFAPIPGDVSMLAGGCFFVNKHSSHVRDAALFIRFVLQRDHQVQLMKHGLCSPLRSTYADAEVQRIPYANALRQSLERGVYMNEAGPDATAISDILTEELQRIWKGDGSVRDGLSRAEDRVTKERNAIYQRLVTSTAPKQ